MSRTDANLFFFFFSKLPSKIHITILGLRGQVRRVVFKLIIVSAPEAIVLLRPKQFILSLYKISEQREWTL